MKQIAIAILCAAVAWAGYWFWSANQREAATEAWIAARQSDGWQVDMDGYSVSGFPNRLDQRFEALSVASPDRATAWQAPFLQIFELSYNPGHLIVALPDTQTLTLNGTPMVIESAGLRASLRHSGGLVDRANIEAETLTIPGALALAGLRGGSQRTDEAAKRYQVNLVADALATKASGLGQMLIADSLRNLQLRSTVHLDQALTTDFAGNPEITQLTIDLAEFEFGALVVKASGDLKVDSAGLINGPLNLRLENWQAGLQLARDHQSLPASMLDGLEAALTLASQLSGRGDTLDVPLTLRGGQIWLGAFPLGPIPQLSSQ